MKDQSEYARLVNQVYQHNNPLQAGKPRSNETFGEELGAIGDIIAHCLVIGDSRLLHDYVIDPIKENLSSGSLTILTFPDSLDSYINAFMDFAEQSGTATGRIYWSLVIETFRNAKEKVQSGYVAIG